jgi:asparagine synthase (glutamine-hydrolysing)
MRPWVGDLGRARAICGITGIYEYGLGQGQVSPDVLVQMRDTLVHRGPDDEGLHISSDRRVGLAHRRLSIVDVVHGAQPMYGASDEVLIFNGEIYNYPALRRELEADGVVFATRCDTEVILHLYAREGADCLARLNGMFAFALWDPRRERLMLARDRVGEKPLYFVDAGGRLLFGSEIKALLAHPSVDAEVNTSVLDAYLANLVTSSPETLFRGIGKLPPGTMALCDRGGLKIRRYWNLFEPRDTAAVDDAGARLREMLRSSIHDRLMSDVPVGVLLSGGLDSTTLVALLDERAADIATFSVGFIDHPELDEREEARRVAETFGTAHHEVTVSEDDAIRFLAGLIHHQDEPLADPVCLPLHFVCRLAREHGVKVVLAGEGADELFWGYPRYRQVLERWWAMRAILALPGPVRASFPRALPASRKPYVHDFLEALGRGRPLPGHLPLGLARAHRREFLRDGAQGLTPGWSPSGDGPADPLTRLMFDTQEYEFGLRLPELLLMRIDRFSMANSVEARVPFLDPEIVEFVYRLPLADKLQNGVGKLILRDAVDGIVPPWVLARRKQGFGAPVVDWLQSSLGDVFRELLNDDAMRRYFDTGMLARALQPDGTSAFSLWPILNFALWHRYWIERTPLPDAVEQYAAT